MLYVFVKLYVFLFVYAIWGLAATIQISAIFHTDLSK